MRKVFTSSLQASVIFTLLFLCFQNLRSEEITFDSLPIPIKEEFLKVASMESIIEIELEKNIGEITVYELVTEQEDIQMAYIFSSDGAILEIEKTIEYDDLPEISRNTLKKLYPELEIKKVESIQLHYFEVKGKLNGETIELQIFNDGNINLEEDEDDEEEID